MDHAPEVFREGSESRRNGATRRLRRPYTFAFALGAIVMAFIVLRKVQTEFEWVYLHSARNFLAGWGLYQLKVPPFRSYTYPPFMAVMSIPLAVLPRMVARICWFLASLGFLAIVWRGTWKLTGGGRLEGAEGSGVDRREHLVAGLGLACALPYLQSGLAHQQTDLLIAALLTAGCLALTRSRDGLAGLSFGLAAGMKCTPLLFAPYLAWRGRWKAAVLVPVVAVGINLLPDLIRPAGGPGAWLGAWCDQFLRPMGQADYLPGRWFAWILDNQSLSGAIGRWTSTLCVWRDGTFAVVERAAPWSAHAVRPLVFGLEALLLAVTWFVLRRGRSDASRGMRGHGTLRDPAEFGVVLLLMLLLSPMSSRPHFGVVLLPSLCLARWAVFEGRRGLFVPLGVTVLTSLLALPWGPGIGRLTMWGGVLTWGTLSLLAGSLWVLSARGAAPARHTPPPKLARRALWTARQRLS